MFGNNRLNEVPFLYKLAPSARLFITNRDQLDRVSYLLGIMKALRLLYVDSLQAYSWIDRANSLPPFNGMTPRQYLLDGSLRHLSDTRRMLDAWRG
jgi:hypothetical protein